MGALSLERVFRHRSGTGQPVFATIQTPLAWGPLDELLGNFLPEDQLGQHVHIALTEGDDPRLLDNTSHFP